MNAWRETEASVHWSGLGGFGGMRNAIRNPIEGRLHPIRDPLGKHLGPLVHSLVGNPDGFGSSGYGPAEQFDRLRLEHATLNHSSRLNATIVQDDASAGAYSFDTLDRMEKRGEDSEVAARRKARDARERKAYGERLTQAFDAGKSLGVTVQKLADALDITYQGVKKALDGEAMPSGKNNTLLARELRVNSDWLATGEGEARPVTNPDAVSGSQEKQLLMMFRKLSPKLRDKVLVAVNVVSRDGTVDISDPFARAPTPQGSRVRGTSTFDEFDDAPVLPPANKRASS